MQKRLFPRRGAGECGCSPGAPGRGGALGWGEAQCWFRCQVCGADGVTCAWVCAHVCERAARQDRHPSVGGVPAEAGSVLTGLRACLPGAEGGAAGPPRAGAEPRPGQLCGASTSCRCRRQSSGASRWACPGGRVPRSRARGPAGSRTERVPRGSRGGGAGVRGRGPVCPAGTAHAGGV